MITLEKIAELASDLSAFADIGTDAPTVEQTVDGYVILLIRLGERSELSINSTTGAISEKFGAGEEIKYINAKALFASERYGNLREWAKKQSAFLHADSALNADALEVLGVLNNALAEVGLSEVDETLVQEQALGSTRVLLIDGPAGIGKTHFLATLARRRADNYVLNRRPLVLHVQSRGRTLSYVVDLIAYSLQRLRLDIMFDQVPVLAKYGLVTLAIDGFDELADPDGYDLAWSQINDLIASLRGSGSIILAGRETFIGRQRVIKDISSLRDGIDEISVLTLQPPTKVKAIDWLKKQGWSPEQVDATEQLFEPSSLALRPFFLSTLADSAIASRISNTSATSILSILVDAMIDREVTKFGEAVEAELSVDKRKKYLKTLMQEVARDLADNLSVSVSDPTLAFLVDVSLPEGVSDSVRRILKGRSSVIAFLTNDDRPGYRRFFHDKFYEYFLSEVLIDTISKGQPSKPVSRNIFGSSYLDTFATVLLFSVTSDTSKEFLSGGLQLLNVYPDIDRTRRNVSALLLASLSIADAISVFSLNSVEIDEARFSGTAAEASLTNAFISQFDCRGGDISRVKFSDCSVITLIADAQTILPEGFPVPVRVRDISSGGETLSEPDEIATWISQHLENQPERPVGLIPKGMRDHPAIKLLGRACRSRSYWLRRSDDVHALKILDDEWWPVIQKALSDSDLLRVEQRDASGTGSPFIHIRQSGEILAEEQGNPDVVKFYRQLIAEISSDS
jgi:hypothetical protein